MWDTTAVRYFAFVRRLEILSSASGGRIVLPRQVWDPGELPSLPDELVCEIARSIRHHARRAGDADSQQRWSALMGLRLHDDVHVVDLDDAEISVDAELTRGGRRRVALGRGSRAAGDRPSRARREVCPSHRSCALAETAVSAAPEPAATSALPRAPGNRRDGARRQRAPSPPRSAVRRTSRSPTRRRRPRGESGGSAARTRGRSPGRAPGRPRGRRRAWPPSSAGPRDRTGRPRRRTASC